MGRKRDGGRDPFSGFAALRIKKLLNPSVCVCVCVGGNIWESWNIVGVER